MTPYTQISNDDSNEFPFTVLFGTGAGSPGGGSAGGGKKKPSKKKPAKPKKKAGELERTTPLINCDHCYVTGDRRAQTTDRITSLVPAFI